MCLEIFSMKKVCRGPKKFEKHWLVDAIEEPTELAPVSLVNSGKTSLSFKGARSLESSRILSLVQVGNIFCKTTLQHIQKSRIFLLIWHRRPANNSKKSFLLNTTSYKLNEVHSLRPNKKIRTLTVTSSPLIRKNWLHEERSDTHVFDMGIRIWQFNNHPMRCQNYGHIETRSCARDNKRCPSP